MVTHKRILTERGRKDGVCSGLETSEKVSRLQDVVSELKNVQSF